MLNSQKQVKKASRPQFEAHNLHKRRPAPATTELWKKKPSQIFNFKLITHVNILNVFLSFSFNLKVAYV